MINLGDGFSESDYETIAERSSEPPGIPCPPEDISMWEEVFRAVLLPTPAELGEMED